MGFFKDFKEFAMKGNVIDMAIGVIIGSAFGKIVSSAVNDIIMPLVSIPLGNVSFTNMKIVLQEAKTHVDPETLEVVVDKAENALTYGNFIQTVVDFLIVALCIFIVIRGINKIKAAAEKKQNEEAAAKAAAEAAAKAAEPPVPTTNDLLIEIRDLLQAKK